MTVTTEVDADFDPGNTGTFAPAFSFPVRPGCSALDFVMHNEGSISSATRYHMDAGSATSYLNVGFNTPSGVSDHKNYTTTNTGPLTQWTGCTVDLGGNVGFVGIVHLTVTQVWSGTDSTYCAYGTQLATPDQFLIYLTPGVIDLVLIGTELGWLAPLFTAFWFTWVNAQTLCSSGPPTMPPITTDTLTSSSPQMIWDALRAVMWPYFCQCAPAPPGSTSPTPFPLPAPTQPVHWPDTPTFDCDDTSLCTLVNQLVRSMAALQSTLQLDYSSDVLSQRQGVPFGYVPGILHSGLTGAGEFTVSDILGLSVAFTTIPLEYPVKAGDPDTYFGIGKISVGTAKGWERSFQANKNPYLILPVSGAMTLVAYNFPIGIVANIEELLREP
jgi:hypothetical protein